MTSARCLSKPQWLRGRCKEMLGEGFFPQAGSLKGRLSEHSVRLSLKGSLKDRTPQRAPG